MCGADWEMFKLRIATQPLDYFMSDVKEWIGDGFCMYREYLEVEGEELSCLILKLTFQY
jgi:hypothetical protein